MCRTLTGMFSKSAICVVVLLAALGCSEDDAPDSTPFDRPRNVGPSPGGTGGSGGSGQATTDSGVIIVSANDMGTAGEESGCTEGDSRPCTVGCGVESCIGGVWNGVCTAVNELCNGADDDCDDLIDEDYENLGLGFRCENEMENGCTSMGTQVCAPSGTGLTCESESVEPSSESCDGLDNDCDGTVDEDFPNQGCCMETAQCPLGQICENNRCGEAGGTTNNGGNTGQGGSAGGTSCGSVLDCNGLEECISGVCREICFADGDCPNGYDCVCPPGADCLYDVCLPSGSSGTGGCALDSECLSGQVCVNGQCTNVGGTCFDNSDCPFGQECDLALGACVDTGGGPSGCQSDFDCGIGEICQNGQCINAGTGGILCLENSDCPVGFICEILICIPDSNPGTGGGFCGQTQPLSGVGTVSGSTQFGSDFVRLDCASNSSEDVVYAWQAPSTGTYEFDTAGSTFDTVLGVFSACDGSGREVSCNDDSVGTTSSVTLTASMGQTFYIVVTGYSVNSGNYTLNYRRIGCNSNADCAANEQCVAGACEARQPENQNFCGNTLIMPATGRILGNTDIGSDVIAPSCGLFEDIDDPNDVVFEWRPTETATYQIETVGNTNTILSIYDACNGMGQELACDDGSGQIASVNDRIDFSAQAFTTYYIGVRAQRDFLGGSFELVITAPDEPECTADWQCGATEVCDNGACVEAMSADCDFDWQCDDGQLCQGGACVLDSDVCDNVIYTAIYGPDYPLVVTGTLDTDRVTNCGSGASVGGDVDYRWFPIRGGNYTVYADADAAAQNVSLAIYSDCAGDNPFLIDCANRWSSAEESVQVTVDLTQIDAYRIVVSGRGANSDGDITLTIECDSGDCAR